jgi:hypothetical protein
LYSSIITYGNRAIFVVVVIVIGASMTDIYFNKLFSYGSDYQSSFQLGIPTFLILGIVYVVGQHLILQFIKNKSKLIRTKKQLQFNIIHKAVYWIQYGLAALLVFFILEMVTTSAYSTVLLTVAIVLSYTLSITMLGLLSIRFFSWFRSNRDSIVFCTGWAL